MARIELEGARPMEELRGFYRSFGNPAENPYTADKLKDDEFNFISGMNFFISCLSENLQQAELYDCTADGFAPLAELKQHIAKAALREFCANAEWEMEKMITSFIDEHEDE